MLVETHPRLAHAAGPLLPYLDDPAVMELRVASSGAVFIVRFGRGKARVEACPAGVLDTFLALVADLVGAEWRAESPRLHAANPALGFRIQAGRPPISDGPWMVCRKHPVRVFPLEDFAAKGILTAAQRATLEQALHRPLTLLIAGAVGSAKTSLLNACLHALRQTKDRIVLVEDDPELLCTAADVQAIRTSDVPRVTMRDLCKDVLRMSPDRLVIGEVRDGAALDMLKAFDTGTAGLATIHAPSAHGTLLRLEQLVQEVSVDPQQHLIGEAIDVIVHLEHHARSWRATEILRVEGFDGQHYSTRSLL